MISRREAAATALDALRRLGAPGEVYSEDGVRAKIAVSEGMIESVEERQDLGIGIRVFLDGRVGFSFTTDLSPEAVHDAALLAREIARYAGRDDASRLPLPSEAPPLPFPNEDPGLPGITMPHRIELARAVEEAALVADPRVQRTRQAVVLDVRGEVEVATTAGARSGYRFSRALAWVDAMASENGASQIAHHAEFGLGAGDLDPVTVGRSASAKAVAKLGSVPARTGRMPVVLDNEVVWGLLEAMAPMFSARRVLKGTSLLAGKLGEKVASDVVTLVDDPRLPGGFGSAPVDGEGLPTRKVVLVESGTLRSYLHDTFSASKMGLGDGGNSVRTSYASPPQIGPMNLLLVPGSEARDALLERAGRGILLTEVMGLHTVDPISGEFSLGGCGQLIEDGRLGSPVDRLAFSGNLIDLLNAVETVGADFELSPSGGGAPSVLLREMSIAGAS